LTGAIVTLNNKQLDKLAGIIAWIPPEYITCDECYEQLDRFADEVLAGKNAAEALPLVQQHLDACHDCHEEFEILLQALKANIEGGES
jgi:hypothetical protein